MCCWPFTEYIIEKPPRKRRQRDMVYLDRSSLGSAVTLVDTAMNRVGQVSDYDQWVKDSNREQTVRVTTAVPTGAASGPTAKSAEAAQPQQLSDPQTGSDRYHTYYYHPRADIAPPYHYYPWPRGALPWYGQAYYNNPLGYHHNWYGRTASEVYQDNIGYATRRHSAGPRRGDQEMVPRDPRDDQMFYVRELDGNWTLRSFNTIEVDLRPGYWDMFHGRAHFVRTRE